MSAEHHHDLICGLLRMGNRLGHPGRPGSGPLRLRRRPTLGALPGAATFDVDGRSIRQSIG